MSQSPPTAPSDDSALSRLPLPVSLLSSAAMHELMSSAADVCSPFPAEVEYGGIEHKLKLVDKSIDRIRHLTTQLNFRLAAGCGTMCYLLGVADDGQPIGLSFGDLEESLRVVQAMAASLDCTCELHWIKTGVRGVCAEVCVQRMRLASPGQQERADAGGAVSAKRSHVTLCVCGDVDTGKSTLISVLSRGKLDNGNGSARMDVFRYRHEIEQGRTSSVAHASFGFDGQQRPIYQSSLGATDIVSASHSLISFIDVAGHEKFQRTTTRALTSSQPDYALLVLNPIAGVTRIWREHLGACLSLKVPVFIVVTKVDICPASSLASTLADLDVVCRSDLVRREPLQVESEDDVRAAIAHFSNSAATQAPRATDGEASGSGLAKSIPIFQVSSVSGAGIGLLQTWLRLLSPRLWWSHAIAQPAMVSIDATFWVPDVGTICAGFVSKGKVCVGDTLLLGPVFGVSASSAAHSATDAPPSPFIPVTISSIHFQRTAVASVHAGQHASFALKKCKRSLIRPGMVLSHVSRTPKCAFGFDAELRVQQHPTGVCQPYTATIHCGSICQSVSIVGMSAVRLHAGERGIVTFRFLNHPECLQKGAKFLLRESNTKAFGKVVKVHHADPSTVAHRYMGRSPSRPPHAEPRLPPPPAPLSGSCRASSSSSVSASEVSRRFEPFRLPSGRSLVLPVPSATPPASSSSSPTAASTDPFVPSATPNFRIRLCRVRPNGRAAPPFRSVAALTPTRSAAEPSCAAATALDFPHTAVGSPVPCAGLASAASAPLGSANSANRSAAAAAAAAAASKKSPASSPALPSSAVSSTSSASSSVSRSRHARAPPSFDDDDIREPSAFFSEASSGADVSAASASAGAGGNGPGCEDEDEDEDAMLFDLGLEKALSHALGRDQKSSFSAPP